MRTHLVVAAAGPAMFVALAACSGSVSGSQPVTSSIPATSSPTSSVSPTASSSPSVADIPKPKGLTLASSTGSLEDVGGLQTKYTGKGSVESIYGSWRLDMADVGFAPEGAVTDSGAIASSFEMGNIHVAFEGNTTSRNGKTVVLITVTKSQ